MTKKYNQLTLMQRYKIEAYLESGKSQSETAISVGVHKSTISRELPRNVPKRGFGAKVYRADRAQSKTEKRHAHKPKHSTFSLPLKLQMKDWMDTRRFSPELVSAQWRKDEIKGVSGECMYQFIWKCKHTNKEENKAFKEVYKFLKHGERRRKRGNYKDARGLIPNRVSIENRPRIVEKRERFGDLEVDLIMGKDHKSALLVTVDRAMRIGINHGSLSDRIMSWYGDTPKGMVESAMEFIRICHQMDYHQLVVSMKSSNPQVMVQAYRLLVQTMVAEGMNYPLHLGVTEAGDGEDGRIKSAVGIGTLLEDGLGDTIRVSLTEDPEFEIPVAKALVNREWKVNVQQVRLAFRLIVCSISLDRNNTFSLL